MGALFVCIYPAKKINLMSKFGMFLTCRLQASEDQISDHMITDLNLNWSTYPIPGSGRENIPT